LYIEVQPALLSSGNDHFPHQEGVQPAVIKNLSECKSNRKRNKNSN